LTIRPQDESVSRPSASTPPIALTIAGFDPSNGAGVTADLQVFAAHGILGTSAITALTIQSTISVAAVDLIWPSNLRETLHHLTSDLPPRGIKIGMLGAAEMVSEVVQHLQQSDEAEPLKNFIPIVLDPVLRSSSGNPLLDLPGLDLLRTDLLHQVTWITPNWQELAILTETDIGSLETVASALDVLHHRYPHLHAVATGGDQAEPIDLLLTPAGEIHQFPGKRIDTTSTHGTGCAFSSAILSRLILGDPPVAAVAAAKDYVVGALQNAPGLGNGRGPLDLLWPLRQHCPQSIQPTQAPLLKKPRGLRWHT
jgi:hydroxymethylpyrimidine/phosphomethylpyrimidine kinase